MASNPHSLLDPILERVNRDFCWEKTQHGPRRTENPLTPHHVTRHLKGVAAFGVCPMKPGEGTTRLALLDFDDHNETLPVNSMADTVQTVIQTGLRAGLAAIPFRSSGGHGIHLYYLWEEPQDAHSVRELLKTLLGRCGLVSGARGVHQKEVEVFPKQDYVPINGYGNMFILPLAGKSVKLNDRLEGIPRRLAERWEWPVSQPVPILEKPVLVKQAPPQTAETAELRALLEAIPNTDTQELDYDQWRNAIFAIHSATGGSDEGLALAHTFSAKASKYDPDFLDNRVWPYINDNRDNPITLDTLRYLARQHEDPADDFEPIPAPVADPASDSDIGDVAASARFRVLDEDELLAQPRPRWFVKWVVPEASLAVLYGASGAGKSFAALDLFACVARGVPWRGLKTQQTKVVYLAAEGQGGFRNRLEAYRQAHDESSQVRVILDTPNFLKGADADLIAKQILTAGGAGIIVIDTLAQAAPGGDENSSEDMGRVLLACRKLRRLTGAMIVLIHHAGKDLTKGSRGWSGLKAAADAEIEVGRLDNQRWLKVSKSKDGEDGREYPFRLRVVELGRDEDGDAITSCVIEHTERMDRGKVREPKGRVERIVWKMAHDLADLGGIEIPVSVLMAEVVKGMTRDESKPDKRRYHVKRAIDSLQDGGFLTVENDVVTVAGVGDDED